MRLGRPTARFSVRSPAKPTATYARQPVEREAIRMHPILEALRVMEVSHLDCLAGNCLACASAAPGS